MRILFFTLLFFFNGLFAFSQKSKIDSLKFELNKAFLIDNNNAKKIKTLYLFCKNQIDKTEIEEFNLYITELISEARLQNNNKYRSLGHQLLSDKYQRIGDYEKALKNSNASIKIAKDKLNDSLQIIFFNQKANVFKFFDKNDSSEVYFQKAINLGIKYKQYRPLGYAYNGMASLKMKIGRYEEAIKVQQKSLSIATKNNLESLEISSLIGLGYLYIRNEDYDKSLVYLKKAQNKFPTFKIIENKEQLCDIYRFIGLAYSRKGNIEEGNDYNKKALQCLEDTDNLMLAADVANTIGANYLRKQQYQKAIPYFKKLIKNTQALNSKSLENFGVINLSSAYIETNQLYEGEKILLEILNDTIDQELLSKGLEKVAYQNLSELYNRKNNHKTSLKYLWKFKTLEDSLNTAQKLREVTEIDVKYQTEKKEKIIEQLRADDAEKELELKNKKNRNELLALFLIITILVIVFLIYLNHKRKKIQKQSNYKYQLEVDLLNQEKTNQQQLIANQTQTIDNLQQTITEKDERNKLQFQEKEAQFHKHLSTYYNLSEVELTYWIDQSNGIIEKQMMQIHSRSKGGIESRGKRLRAKIKEKKGIDSSITLSKEDMTRYYKEDLIKFNQ